ncbi:MFS transporter [[Acidovorax] ebreus]|uniref:MFS transporter n=1 Tax=Diaphorobacter sp. LI3 TaxID=2952886 RepID=UPI002045EB59|nr:MFS transporter [Diaphorobacter sp. LI3]
MRLFRTQPLWVMLLTLLSGFALSQAYRTTTAIVAQGLQADFGLQASSLGAFAGLFGLSFGIAQLLMGIALDRYGLRRTVLVAAPLGIAGAALSALAPSYGWLMVGQVLIGVGYSPAFVACTLFIARYFAADRFAFFSGLSMGLGGLGLLFTGTPLAWVVQHWGWRAGFGLLAGLSLLSWLLIYALVHEPARADTAHRPASSWGEALTGMGRLFTVPHTWGIVILGMSCYAAFLSLRGLWLGPLLIDRYGFSLVDSGNVALVLSLIALFTPAAFGRMDPGPARRRTWVGRASLSMAGLFAIMAWVNNAHATVALMIAMGLLSGYSILQYADVRSSYPNEQTGRALSLYTMAMFLGVALMQSLTGAVAAWATSAGLEPYRAVLLCIAAWLALASLAFRLLPASALLQQR